MLKTVSALASLGTMAIFGAPDHGLAGTTSSTLRTDLVSGLGELLCGEADSSAKDLSATALWKVGIFDGQVEGTHVSRRDGQSMNPDEIAAMAGRYARSKRMGGYSYGICKDGRSWLAAVPAPKPLQTGDTWSVPWDILNDHCRSWRIDYAKAQGGRSIQLQTSKTQTLNVAKLEQGTISISCLPKKPKWQGPVLWYLAPVHGTSELPIPLPSLIDPKVDALTETKVDGPRPLIQWIAAVRRHEKLPPMVMDSRLSGQADLLSVNQSVIHNRTSLLQARARLHKEGLHLLGENRVKGRDASAMAWLLWNSPRHRSLLLAANANTFGLAFKRIAGGYLAVLLTASKTEKKVARP